MAIGGKLNAPKSLEVGDAVVAKCEMRLSVLIDKLAQIGAKIPSIAGIQSDRILESRQNAHKTRMKSSRQSRFVNRFRV